METKPLLSHTVWIFEALIGIALIIAANYAIKIFLKYLRNHRSKEHDWKEKAEHIFYAPLRFFLWVFAAVYVLQIIGEQLGFEAFLMYLSPVQEAAAAACLGWILVRWKAEMEHSLIAQKKQGLRSVDVNVIQVVGRLLTIAILIVTTMIVLQIVGINILPILTFGGIGAAALAFAGKDVLANFFGGLMLQITRSFSPGDQILIPERSIEGTVEEIGWYLTSLRDKEQRPLYLPNSVFSTLMVVNASRMTHRRIQETIKIRPSDISKIQVIVQKIKTELAANSAIDKNLPILCNFHAFGEYALDIFIECFTLATDQEEYLGVKQEIMMRIQEIIAGSGAEIPLPTYKYV